MSAPAAAATLPLPETTIVVVPRERFAVTRRALETLYRETDYPFRLVYVDAGSPAEIARYLEEQARQRGFELLRFDRYLSPNEARNLGAARASGRYVVFVDNDLLVARGWLAALVRCAEETGADLVGPVYGAGEPEEGRIHMAGGTAQIHERAGPRRFTESHRFVGLLLREIGPELRRETTELVEYHCMLARRETLDALGPLDEELLSMAEHIDLCLAVRQRGGSVYLEPSSRVTYLPPPPLDAADRRFFQLRWSEAWARRSYAHFRQKWRLDPDDPYFRQNLSFLRSHRRLPLQNTQRFLDR
ncbi:MAG: glycosyltransferase family 2 protein, partial [Thermoanaerobaculia bacterium]